MMRIRSAGSFGAAAIVLLAILCSCAGPSAKDEATAAPSPTSGVRRLLQSRQAIQAEQSGARAYLRSHDCLGDWESGRPVPGHPGEVTLSDGEVVEQPPYDGSPPPSPLRSAAVSACPKTTGTASPGP
jgi:hypothetical protein